METTKPTEMETDTTQTLDATLARILETLEFASAQRTTQQQRNENLSDKQRLELRVKWIDKWLHLKRTHPQIETLQSSVYDFCRDYACNPRRGRRLIIYGENGSGKTHVAKAIHRWAKSIALQIPLVDGEEGVRLANTEFYHFPTLIQKLPQHWELISELCDGDTAPSLLVLDDIGAEHDPLSGAKFGAAQLYMLLEKRERKWTVFTTNYKPDAWSDRWDRRVSSRLLRNCDHISLTDVPDFSSL